MCKRKYTLSRIIIIIIIIAVGCEDQYILSYNLNPGIQSVIKYILSYWKDYWDRDQLKRERLILLCELHSHVCMSPTVISCVNNL